MAVIGTQVDSRSDLRVAQRAARQWGVVSREQLLACGLTPSAISVRVRRSQLHRLYRGVYALGHDHLALEGRFLAAVLACGPGAVLSHFAAAALYGLIRWDDRYPEVTVAGCTTRCHRGIRVHRTSLLQPVDATTHRGVPVTSPARTVVDVASVAGPRMQRRVVRQAQSLGLVELQHLAETMRRLGPRRGSRSLSRIIATGPAPTRSELEDVVLDLMLDGGIAPPDVNVPLVLGGRRVVPDFRWPEQNLVVEADGAAWHDHRLAREDDAERQALLEAHGEHVIRVTWDQAVAKPRETLARIRAAGAPNRHRASTSAA